MRYWPTGMVVICCACVLISCSPAGVRFRPTVVSAVIVTPTLTPTRADIPTSGLPTSIAASTPDGHGKENEMADLRRCILGHWIHSHEEDAEGMMVYRPASYNFPPSRGRRGLDFREGGELVYYGIGRADGSEQFSGSWVLEEPNRVRITVNSAQIQPFVWQVVSCNDQALKVRR